MDMQGAYAVLGLSPTASLEEAKRAFRTRAQLMHPDRVTAGLRGEAESAMAQINEAWSMVRDHIERNGPGLPPGDIPRSRQGASASDAPRPTSRMPYVGECDLCGWEPASPIKLRRVTGAVLWHSRAIAEPELCRLCADSFYTETQAQCLMKGWWGIFAPLVNLYSVTMNRLSVAAHRKTIAHVQSRDPMVATPLAHPMRVAPLRRRPAPIALTLLAGLIASVIIADAATPDGAATTGGGGGTGTAPHTGTVGTCLTQGGHVVGCQDPAAVFELTEKVGTPDLCADEAFQDPTDKQWYCASDI